MFKPRFIYNPETLSYDKQPFIEAYRGYIVGGCAILLVGLVLGVWLGETDERVANLDEYEDEWAMPSKHDMVIGTTEWKDSVFLDYQVRADLYLERDEFKGTHIKGAMLALAAHNAFDSTGILLPVELCLAQCQWESGMGLKGRSPRNNPFNVGEYDSGTVIWFDDTTGFEGTQEYFYLMCTNYLPCKSLGELFQNFTNCSGKRYASGQYEKHVPPQYYYIKRWLRKELSK